MRAWVIPPSIKSNVQICMSVFSQTAWLGSLSGVCVWVRQPWPGLEPSVVTALVCGPVSQWQEETRANEMVPHSSAFVVWERSHISVFLCHCCPPLSHVFLYSLSFWLISKSLVSMQHGLGCGLVFHVGLLHANPVLGQIQSFKSQLNYSWEAKILVKWGKLETSAASKSKGAFKKNLNKSDWSSS